MLSSLLYNMHHRIVRVVQLSLVIGFVVCACDATPLFKGVVVLPSGVVFNLSKEDGSESSWVRIGDLFDEYTIVQYSSSKEVLTVSRGGQFLAIKLADSKVQKAVLEDELFQAQISKPPLDENTLFIRIRGNQQIFVDDRLADEAAALKVMSEFTNQKVNRYVFLHVVGDKNFEFANSFLQRMEKLGIKKIRLTANPKNYP